MAVAGLIVRPEAQEDVRAVAKVVTAAFGDEPVAELLDGLRRSTAWRDLSFVAELDGQVAGHVSFTRGWLDAPRRLVEVLVLSLLAVRPDLQRQGIGGELVRRSLARIEEQRSEPLVFLEGSPAYYGGLGFVTAERLGFSRPSVRIPPAACQVVRLPSYEDWMTGALVYPDVFWQHDAVGLRGVASG